MTEEQRIKRRAWEREWSRTLEQKARKAARDRKRPKRDRAAYGLAWARKNIEKARAYGKKWRDANVERNRERGRRYYQSHRSQRADYAKKNKKRYNAFRRIWQSQKLKTDPDFRMKRILRARLRGAMREAGAVQVESAVKLIGCSIERFREHLQSLFLPCMSWKNYGEWHVDHKRPCASFDLTNSEQQRQCFHYTNLQPLWAVDNLRKGAKFCQAIS